jgi:hypothetical protein
MPVSRASIGLFRRRTLQGSGFNSTKKDANPRIIVSIKSSTFFLTNHNSSTYFFVQKN